MRKRNFTRLLFSNRKPYLNFSFFTGIQVKQVVIFSNFRQFLRTLEISYHLSKTNITICDYN